MLLFHVNIPFGEKTILLLIIKVVRPIIKYILFEYGYIIKKAMGYIFNAIKCDQFKCSMTKL